MTYTTSKHPWFSAVLLLCAGALLSGCSKRYEARPAESSLPDPTPPATILSPDPVVYALHPAPAPSSAPKTAEAGRAQPSLTVKRLVLATGVQNREPEGASKGFFASKTDKLYAFVEVENHSRTEGEIFVSFVPPGGGPSVGHIPLSVGAERRWRTWAYTKNARKPGEWMAIIKNGSGDILARAPFEIML